MHNLQTRRKNSKEQLVVANEVSVNVKTNNNFKYDYFSVFILCLKNITFSIYIKRIISNTYINVLYITFYIYIYKSL